VFRLILAAFSALFPMPSYPTLYHTVGTVQEYVLPKGPEGTGGPGIVYREHAVRPEEVWAEDPARGPYRADYREADILPDDCLDLGWRIGPSAGPPHCRADREFARPLGLLLCG